MKDSPTENQIRRWLDRTAKLRKRRPPDGSVLVPVDKPKPPKQGGAEAALELELEE